jgi:undecaprenyl-diphosphatase
MLPVTGALLLLLPRFGTGTKEYQQIGLGTALLIGIAQAAALLPGISRSGSTIVAGVGLGLNRQAAATFSFLLAIPAIAGAGTLEFMQQFFGSGSDQSSDTSFGLMLVGALISLGVGLLSLRWLTVCVNRGNLHYFAYWVIPVGILLIVWQLYTIFDANVQAFRY